MDRRETRPRIGIVTSDLATSLARPLVEACTLSEFQREVPHSIQVKTLQVCFPCGPELVEVSDPLSGGVMLLCLPLLIGNSNDLVDVLSGPS